jgi:Thioredoxin-like domain
MIDGSQMKTSAPVRLGRLGRRRAATLLLAPVLAACAPGAGQAGQGGAGSQGSAGDPPGVMRVQTVVPNTDLSVGRNRFALGVLQIARDTTTPVPVPDASLALKFFHPVEPQPVPKGEAAPEFRFVDDKRKGLYVAQVQFDQPGDWGVEVSGSAAGQPLTTTRIRFAVKPKSDTPAIGAPAPRSRNLTRHDVDDVRKIDSGATPNDMHELSIADALEQGKPLVVIFSSPGFCMTQTCAPQLGEVQKLKARFGQQASFVHVEIFKDPATRTPYEAVTEWGLTSEPWTFFVDKQGLVAEKFEGPAPYAELEPALQKLV